MSSNSPYSPYSRPPQGAQGPFGQPGSFSPGSFGGPGHPGSHGGFPAGPIGAPTPPNAPQRSRRGQARLGASYAAGYVVVIWSVHLISVLLFGGNLVHFGIHPLDTSSLPFIFTSPILHANFEHLLSNTVPGAIFAFLVGYSGHRVFWEVTAYVVIVGGLGTWLFGGIGTNHIGASMLVYGWLAYLLVRGIFNKSPSEVAIGVVLGLTYSGLVWGLLPLTPGVSWQAHLFGALGGITAGIFITSDDPPALKAKKQAEKAQKDYEKSMKNAARGAQRQARGRR